MFNKSQFCLVPLMVQKWQTLPFMINFIFQVPMFQLYIFFLTFSSRTVNIFKQLCSLCHSHLSHWPRKNYLLSWSLIYRVYYKRYIPSMNWEQKHLLKPDTAWKELDIFHFIEIENKSFISFSILLNDMQFHLPHFYTHLVYVKINSQ